MKKILIIIAAALTALSAAAQNTEKLNFEAPLFGVAKKNVKPKWSVVAFGGVQAGYSYRFVEDPIRSTGLFGELDLIDFRLRPWRDGNSFSWGCPAPSMSNALPKGRSLRRTAVSPACQSAGSGRAHTPPSLSHP